MKVPLRVPTALLAVLLPSIGWTASLDQPNTGAQRSASEPSPVRTLTHIELKGNGGDAAVLLRGDGRLSYRIRSLSTDRVIVDLPYTATKLGHAFEFNNPVVRQIRIGQHPNVLRLVIDLRQSAVYSVQEGKHSLSVVLTPRTDVKKMSDTVVASQQSPNVQPDIAAIGPEVPSRQERSDRGKPAISESDPTASGPHQSRGTRTRAVDRRVTEPPASQSSTERYVAAFGGVSFSQSFTKVHGTGEDASVNVSDLALKGTGIGGLKLGFSTAGAKWMALETEVFYASPHIKQQTVTVTGPGGQRSDDVAGSHTRVATWAFNWILRYPGEWIQPYAGAGLGIFWGRLADSGGTSSSDTSPGLNALAGLRFKVGQHALLFSEYKYNRTSFDFSGADFHVVYQAHYIVGGLGIQF